MKHKQHDSATTMCHHKDAAFKGTGLVKFSAPSSILYEDQDTNLFLSDKSIFFHVG